MKMHRGLLFDLDGVIVDTAEYHYLAWKEIAGQLGIPFTRKDNERLKGISRMDSLEILLNIGRRKLGQEESRRYCEEKNNIYLRYIRKMGKDGLLPGVLDFLHEAKRMKYLLALGSASQNAELILERLELTACFDAVIDGTKISRAKPDPEVFVKGASALGVEPEECIVFEDSAAGIRAAHAGGNEGHRYREPGESAGGRRDPGWILWNHSGDGGSHAYMKMGDRILPERFGGGIPKGRYG